MTKKKSNNEIDIVKPVAVALWFIDNTSITFEQIAEFCKISIVEVKSIADGIFADGILPKNPIKANYITKEEIQLAENDENHKIRYNLVGNSNVIASKVRTKKLYIPLAIRKNKMDAILWFARNANTVSNATLKKLLGTTTSTIDKIRNGTYSQMDELTPKDPVLLGFCTQIELTD
jgi:hypothetical protein